MTTTHIRYNKILTTIQTVNNFTTVKNSKIGTLESIISNLESFVIHLDNTKVKKTIKKIENLGFIVDIDKNFGFDWECKIYCSL
jgi:hypothetical protein